MATGQSSSEPPNRRERRRPKVEKNPLMPSDDDYEPGRPYYKYLIKDYNKKSNDWRLKAIIGSKVAHELSDIDLAVPEDDRKTMEQIIHEELQVFKNRRKFLKRAQPLKHVIGDVLDEDLLKGLVYSVEQAAEAELGTEHPQKSDPVPEGKGKQHA